MLLLLRMRLLLLLLLQLTVLKHVVHWNTASSHDVISHGTVRPRAGFRRVGKGQPGRVDDSVIPDERNRNLGGLPDPLPTAPELCDVRDNTEHALLAPVHGLGLDISEPDSKVRAEVLAGQFEHGCLASTV